MVAPGQTLQSCEKSGVATQTLLPFMRPAVAAEIPARADRGVKAVGPGCAEIGEADVMAVFPESVRLMLRNAELEIFRQFEAKADRALERNPGHRRSVFELRNIIPE